MHGTAVVGPEPPALNVLENVPGTSWTDVMGLRQGWGSTFRGKANTHGWFHLPFPTPIQLFDAASGLEWVEVGFTIDGPAHVESLHLWSGRERIAAVDGQQLVNGARHQFDEPRIVSHALNVCLGVRFNEPANITIHGGKASVLGMARPVR